MEFEIDFASFYLYFYFIVIIVFMLLGHLLAQNYDVLLLDAFVQEKRDRNRIIDEIDNILHSVLLDYY